MLVTAVVLVALLASGWLVTSQVLGRHIERKLKAMVAKHLEAELRMDSLSYRPPYTVTLSKAKLVATAGDGQKFDLLEVPHLKLTLAELPIHKRPLLIERLSIDRPAVKFIQARPETAVVKEEPEQKQEPKPKPSDVFRLRHVDITGGQFTYEDRTRPGTVPAVWRNLDLDLKIDPKSGSLYAWHFVANNQPVAKLDAGGTFDVDEAWVEASKLRLDAKVDSSAGESPLPAVIQQVLRQYGVGGELALDAQGRLPLRDVSHGTYRATLDLKQAAAAWPKADARLDRLSLRLECSSGKSGEGAAHSAPPTDFVLTHFDAISGNVALRLDKAKAHVDPAGNQWTLTDLSGQLDGAGPRGTPATRPRLSGIATSAPSTSRVQTMVDRLNISGSVEFTGAAEGPLRPKSKKEAADEAEIEFLAYPRDFTIQPPKFPQAIEHIGGGSIQAVKSVVKVENLTAFYGRDRLYLQSARIPLQGLKDQFRLEEISGTLNFNPPSPEYPRPLKDTIEKLRPAGPFVIGGNYYHKNFGDKPRATYNFMVSSDQGAFFVLDKRIPLTKIRGDATVIPDAVDITSFKCNTLGGTMTAVAAIKTGKNWSFDGQGSLRDVDVKHVADLYHLNDKADRQGKPEKFRGRGFATLRLTGHKPEPGHRAVETYGGSGEAEIVDGYFWDFPVLKEILGNTKTAQEITTASQAAAVFDFRDQVANLRHAAVSAPILGLQGSGEVGFDGRLNLQVLAAPLADWERQLKQNGAGNVVADFFGAIQKVLNAATGNLLYNFRVTGTASHPTVTPIPVPVLTEGVANVFGGMIKSRDGRLIQSLRDEPPKPPAKAAADKGDARKDQGAPGKLGG